MTCDNQTNVPPRHRGTQNPSVGANAVGPGPYVGRVAQPVPMGLSLRFRFVGDQPRNIGSQ